MSPDLEAAKKILDKNISISEQEQIKNINKKLTAHKKSSIQKIIFTYASTF